MRFNLRWFRVIFNRPVIILIVSILISLGLAISISYYSLTTHLEDDYLWLNNKHVELGFPKNWYAMTWIETEQGAGENFCIQMAPPDGNMFSVIIMMIYDTQATQIYMDENNLTDTTSVVTFVANNLYQWALQNNANATLVFTENSTSTVSGQKANYATFIVENGYDSDGSFLNLSCTFISQINQQRLVQFLFWGNEQDCLTVGEEFEAIVKTVRVKNY